MSASKEIPTRPLGRNGPNVPRLGLGLMPLSGWYNLPPKDEERLAFLDEAWRVGARFWDTSDYYGDNEDIIGKWFALNPDKRADIFLATKFGHPVPPLNTAGINSSAEYCPRALDRSLARLGLPYVDLFYAHRLDKVTPIEHTVAAMAALQAAGKIKHIGLSECSATTLRRAHAVAPITAVQMEYSPFCREIEAEADAFGAGRYCLLATARELGVAVVCYSPLGNGLLGGDVRSVADVQKPGDVRGGIPWLSEANAEGNLAVVARLRELAEKKGVSVAQLALAWIFKQGEDVFPIPGTTKPHRLVENLKSLEVELSNEEEKEVRAVASGITGARLPEFMLEDCFLDTPALQS